MAKRDTPGIDETRNCHLSFELTQKIGSRSAVSIRARDQKKTIASTGRIQDRKSVCCQTVDHPCKWGASIQVISNLQPDIALPR